MELHKKINMVVFNHIPRTSGTFILQKLRTSGFAGGVRIDFNLPEKWIPEIYCDIYFRPVMMRYHVRGKEFGRVHIRRPGDFVFTFLRNRVDMAYSNFAFMKMRVVRGDCFPNWNYEQYSYYRQTVQEHVDVLLRSGEPDDTYPTNLAIYDFIGITEEMDRSLEVLNRVLGTQIVNDCLINAVPCEKTYRRRELEQKFGRELRMYELARAKLFSSGYDNLVLFA